MPEEQPHTIEPIEVKAPKRSKWQGISNRLLLIAMAGITVGVGFFLYWSFQPEDILKANNEPFPSRVVKDGTGSNGILILNVDFCKNVAIEGQIRTSFVSSSREIFLPIAKERAEKGCRVTEFPIIIPKELPADKYYVKFRATYDINPLKKTVASEFKSQEFQIGGEVK